MKFWSSYIFRNGYIKLINIHDITYILFMAKHLKSTFLLMEEMAQWVKHLLHRPKHMRSDPQKPWGMVEHIHNPGFYRETGSGVKRISARS